MKNKTTIKTETIFLVLSLIFGLIFAISIPPTDVHDEGTHINKAYDVSEGNIFPKIAHIIVPKNLEHNVYQPITNGGMINVDMSTESIITYPPLPYLVVP